MRVCFFEEELIKDNKEFCQVIDGLIDSWCERRALQPLRILLPAWPLGMGLTDDWQRVREALRHLRAMAGKSLPQNEQKQLNELIAAVDQILY
jgi:hypothetical protein